MPVTDEPHSAREKEREQREREKRKREKDGERGVVLERAEHMSITICLNLASKVGLFVLACIGRWER